MISTKKDAIILIVLLSFMAGVGCQMIIGNIEYNHKLTDKINTIADSKDPRFRIGDDIFRIERVNISIFEVNINDTFSGAP